jgi:hypothetical protein
MAAFKKTMRQLASGVFVITTRLDERPHERTPRGLKLL